METEEERVMLDGSRVEESGTGEHLGEEGGQPGLEEGDGGQHFREDRFHGLSLSDALIYMNGCYQNWNR